LDNPWKVRSIFHVSYITPVYTTVGGCAEYLTSYAILRLE